MHPHEEPAVRALFRLGWPYCWLARMFAECWTRKLDTAYTIPGLSGQDSVSTYSRPRAASVGPISSPQLLRIKQLISLYATIVHCTHDDHCGHTASIAV